MSTAIMGMLKALFSTMFAVFSPILFMLRSSSFVLGTVLLKLSMRVWETSRMTPAFLRYIPLGFTVSSSSSMGMASSSCGVLMVLKSWLQTLAMFSSLVLRLSKVAMRMV